MDHSDYLLIDSGEGKKLEQFGPYTISRPAAQALWLPALSKKQWKSANATFTREPEMRWLKGIQEEWSIEVASIRFHLKLTDFGHLGLFPEQRDQWEWLQTFLPKEEKKRERPLRVLNLFAYSGGATLAAAKGGAEVCHLDASKGMVQWARDNAKLNGLENHPIRWIVDDVIKFLQREERRGNHYDGIILDPPTYGKGSRGEVFKFEKELNHLLHLCRSVLSKDPAFILLSCHTPNVTPTILTNILTQLMEPFGGATEGGEMLLKGKEGILPLPSGVFARWTNA